MVNLCEQVKIRDPTAKRLSRLLEAQINTVVGLHGVPELPYRLVADHRASIFGDPICLTYGSAISSKKKRLYAVAK